MQHVYEKFLLPMSDLYKIPSHVNQEEYLESVATDLAGYSNEALAMAFNHFRKSRKYTTMPSIADMIEACDRFKNVADLEARREQKRIREMLEDQREKQSLAWSDSRKIIARQKLLECAHAKKAAEEGWISWLYDHYRYNDREPTVKQLVEMRESFESDALATQKYPLGVRMWADTLNRRAALKQRLTDLVLHGIIPEGIRG